MNWGEKLLFRTNLGAAKWSKQQDRPRDRCRSAGGLAALLLADGPLTAPLHPGSLPSHYFSFIEFFSCNTKAPRVYYKWLGGDASPKVCSHTPGELMRPAPKEADLRYVDGGRLANGSESLPRLAEGRGHLYF